MKLIQKEISACRGCPYLEDAVGPYCDAPGGPPSLKDSEINDLHTIPEWCPLPDAENDRWVPVAERLPEIFNPVFAVTKNNEKYGVAFIGSNGNWVWCWSNRPKNTTSLDLLWISHWRPLPPGPEEE